MTPEERKKLYAALSAPFGEDAIERTDGHVTGRGYDTTGIKYQYVVNRLNEVLGIGGWRTQQTIDVRQTTTAKGRTSFEATCQLTLQFGQWTEGRYLPWAEVFATGGHQSLSEADARKGAFTNGLKKAAAMCGCGKQAYEGTLDDDNVPVDPQQPQPASQPQQPQPASQPQQQSARTPPQQQPQPASQPQQQSARTPKPQQQRPAEPAAAPPRTGGVSQKQLGLIWSMARRLGYDTDTFRQEVADRFGCQLEAMDPRTASALIQQLHASAANGAAHPER